MIVTDVNQLKVGMYLVVSKNRDCRYEVVTSIDTDDQLYSSLYIGMGNDTVQDDPCGSYLEKRTRIISDYKTKEIAIKNLTKEIT